MTTWTAICRRADLGRKPLAVTVAGVALVLFRDSSGAARALEDLCPHRGVPLSLGRVRRGNLQCAYHGWEFDGQGLCRLIPSDVEPTGARLTCRAFEAREVDGRIEVAMTDAGAGSRAGKRRARWAGPADNQALIDLVRACPMKGSVEMYFDRAPDFFALCRLQGAGAKVAVVDDKVPGRIAAAGAIADFPAVYVDGKVRQAAYACDLRVHPELRGGLLVKRIYDFMSAHSAEVGWDLGFTAIMKGNDAMAAVLEGKGAVVTYRHMATMRNFTVQFLLRKRPPKGISVRPATEIDIPAMLDIWNRLQAGKHFAPVWTEASMRSLLDESRGLKIGDYSLAFRGDRLTGLLLAWRQEGFKRMVVLGFSPEMQRMRRWYNPLARLLRLALIPGVGQAMPYFYATHPCAETADDLRALYVDVYNRHRNPETLFFSTMLDTRDPLLPALDGFTTQHVDIELYLLDPLGKFADLAASAKPCYFDPAIV
ncbi:MAG: Rieske 2Fe-2S domain-containing protein [Candidatus Sericytochromatia bacterium]|uniref:Rieske 2Fe-2S domain-containing protein n=1 Tax=Candidatus Tanganyikabacteria bacterium TaxID=2961651 RepID=A0A938BHY0_9BACT|nr:Rieske 2Fe-2S domain-containing protein [Candidatus Tanganyikabacteria bacterium]